MSERNGVPTWTTSEDAANFLAIGQARVSQLGQSGKIRVKIIPTSGKGVGKPRVMYRVSDLYAVRRERMGTRGRL